MEPDGKDLWKTIFLYNPVVFYGFQVPCVSLPGFRSAVGRQSTCTVYGLVTWDDLRTASFSLLEPSPLRFSIVCTLRKPLMEGSVRWAYTPCWAVSQCDLLRPTWRHTLMDMRTDSIAVATRQPK